MAAWSRPTGRLSSGKALRLDLAGPGLIEGQPATLEDLAPCREHSPRTSASADPYSAARLRAIYAVLQRQNLQREQRSQRDPVHHLGRREGRRRDAWSCSLRRRRRPTSGKPRTARLLRDQHATAEPLPAEPCPRNANPDPGDRRKSIGGVHPWLRDRPRIPRMDAERRQNIARLRASKRRAQSDQTRVWGRRNAVRKSDDNAQQCSKPEGVGSPPLRRSGPWPRRGCSST